LFTVISPREVVKVFEETLGVIFVFEPYANDLLALRIPWFAQ
jgi:hypothetical protein